MTGPELLELLHKAKRRTHLIGNPENGIIVGLDIEGRLFTVLKGQVLNRVVPSAILNHSNKHIYHNPGGDALWPAPEGTCFGYEYGTGKWRVPPAITGAVWEVEKSVNKSVIRAEIDLVSNLQIGIPCEFERHITFECHDKSLIQNVTEVIRYIGVKTLDKEKFRLAPWSLCQFDVSPESKVILPPPFAEEIWDMYDSSLSQRGMAGDKYTVDPKTDFRFQLGLGAKVAWIEYLSGGKFSVRRNAGPLPSGQSYIDIADAPPEQFPSDNGVKLSIYCDPSGFMEIEACGGCPDRLVPGTELSVSIITEYNQHHVSIR